MYLLDSIDKGTGLRETAGKEDPVVLDFTIMLMSYLQGVDYVVVFFLFCERTFKVSKLKYRDLLSYLSKVLLVILSVLFVFFFKENDRFLQRFPNCYSGSLAGAAHGLKYNVNVFKMSSVGTEIKY